MNDDELIKFEAEGAAPLPASGLTGYVDHDNARIWRCSYGAGMPVILLHGGLGNSRNWGSQVPALVSHGYRAVVIDSRGHGRNTRDDRPYSYERLAGDVLALTDSLRIEMAAAAGGRTEGSASLKQTGGASTITRRFRRPALRPGPSGERARAPSRNGAHLW